jgi:hypothetical protein
MAKPVRSSRSNTVQEAQVEEAVSRWIEARPIAMYSALWSELSANERLALGIVCGRNTSSQGVVAS